MFNVVFLVSGGEPDGTTDILVSEAYRWAFTREAQYGYAAAYAVLIFLLLARRSIGARRSRRIAGEAQGGAHVARRARREPAPSSRSPCTPSLVVGGRVRALPGALGRLARASPGARPTARAGAAHPARADARATSRRGRRRRATPATPLALRAASSSTRSSSSLATAAVGVVDRHPDGVRARALPVRRQGARRCARCSRRRCSRRWRARSRST